jgi:hypothetical protein
MAIPPTELRTVDIFGRAKKDPVKDFSNKLSEVIRSPEFLEKLSNEIGSPRKFESEDSFVERAKLAMKKVLLEKLDR